MMDSLSVATWILAILAGIVLLLCIATCIVLLYITCRKRKADQVYELTSLGANYDTGIFGNYNYTDSGYSALDRVERGEQRQELAVGKLEAKGPGDEVGRTGDEVGRTDDEARGPNNKQAKKFRLFRRKLSFRQQQQQARPQTRTDIVDAFDFPPKDPVRKKRVMFQTRLCRSEMDIYEMRSSLDMQETEKLLKTTERKQLSDTLTEEEGKSQYFDALEYITEDEYFDDKGEDNEDVEDVEDVEVEREEDYEDIGDLEEDVCEKQHLKLNIKKHRKLVQTRSEPHYPPEVLRRVRALKLLLYKQKQTEFKFARDVHLLESRFSKLNREKLYENRRKLVEGTDFAQGTILELEEEVDIENSFTAEQEESIKSTSDIGIPGFWMRVILNSKNLSTIVQATDIACLTSLTNISIVYLEKPFGFRLVFSFKDNDFFTNSELTKDYDLKYEPDIGEDPLNFEGLEISGCRGCRIHWKRHHNLTVRPVKKVHNHKIVTRWARKNSFFNFFHPPKAQDPGDVHFLRQRELLEAHFELGLFFKEQIVPKAFLFYSIPGYDRNLSKSKTIGGLKKPKVMKSSSLCLTPVRRKSRHSEGEGGGEGEGGALGGEELGAAATNHSDVENEASSISSTTKHLHQNGGSNYLVAASPAADIEVEVSGGVEEVVEEVEEVVEPDLLAGKYLMESSDKFDEVLKVLGVGLVRRKLANSVVPTNVIKIDRGGIYTIKTLTNVRNSEISFQLGVPFIEDTIDGRKTNTIATREGNCLTLVQKGDESKGEKDSRMVRRVEGDTMHMQIIVEGTVCSRIYKRVLE